MRVLIKKRGLFAGVLIQAVVMMVCLFLSAQKVAADAVQADACQSCHIGMLKHPAVKAPTLERCVSCHADNAQRDRLTKVSRPHTFNAVEINTGSTLKVEAVEPTSGMQLPITYQGSRIGKQPNEMVLIPAGPFTMGSDNRLPDESPAHEVMLKAYFLDRYEVTNLQYKQFIDATQRKSPRHFENRTFPQGYADHPVVYVTWYDAQAYCQWAGKRLPTGEEWEKGARGTDARVYPWGDTFDITRANMPQRWHTLERKGSTTPVGAFEGGKSPYGLYDMSGNVWEWTSSWYKAYPGNQKPTENYGETYKTLKGGSWWNCSFYKCGASAPVFNRSFFLRTTRNKSFGFRCAKDSGDEA